MPEILFPPRALRTFVETVSAEIGADNLFSILEKAGVARIHADPSVARALDAATAARSYASIQQAMRVYYGRGARGTLLRVGAGWWPRLIDDAPVDVKLQMMLARLLPTSARRKAALNLVALLVSLHVGEITTYPLDLDLLLVDHTSPATTGQRADEPICWVTLGLVREALRWADPGEYDVTETACRAQGAHQCEFKIVIGG